MLNREVGELEKQSFRPSPQLLGFLTRFDAHLSPSEVATYRTMTDQALAVERAVFSLDQRYSGQPSVDDTEERRAITWFEDAADREESKFSAQGGFVTQQVSRYRQVAIELRTAVIPTDRGQQRLKLQDVVAARVVLDELHDEAMDTLGGLATRSYHGSGYNVAHREESLRKEKVAQLQERLTSLTQDTSHISPDDKEFMEVEGNVQRFQHVLRVLDELNSGGGPVQEDFTDKDVDDMELDEVQQLRLLLYLVDPEQYQLSLAHIHTLYEYSLEGSHTRAELEDIANNFLDELGYVREKTSDTDDAEEVPPSLFYQTPPAGRLRFAVEQLRLNETHTIGESKRKKAEDILDQYRKALIQDAQRSEVEKGGGYITTLPPDIAAAIEAQINAIPLTELIDQAYAYAEEKQGLEEQLIIRRAIAPGAKFTDTGYAMLLLRTQYDAALTAAHGRAEQSLKIQLGDRSIFAYPTPRQIEILATELYLQSLQKAA